jgi:hypothetical protein
MEAQTIICPSCQTPNPARNLYCQSCGKPLVPTAPNFTAPPPPMAAQPVFDPLAPPALEPVPAYPVQGEPLPQPEPPPVYPPQEMPPQGYPPQQMAPQGYPPQQVAPPPPAYYAPPPPPPPVPAVPTLEKLGARTDGWSDLIAGASEKTGEVEEAFLVGLKEREIPQVTIEKVEFASGMFRKAYQVVRSPAGTVAVQVSAAGKDLAISWSLYTRHGLNLPMLGILAAIAFGVSFLTSLGGAFNFGIFFVNWVFGTFRWLLDTVILALIAGYVWKGSTWYFFLLTPDEIARDELAALTLAVHDSLHSAVDKSGLDSSKLRGKSAFRAGDPYRIL